MQEIFFSADYITACQDAAISVLFVPSAPSDMLWETFTSAVIVLAEWQPNGRNKGTLSRAPCCFHHLLFVMVLGRLKLTGMESMTHSLLFAWLLEQSNNRRHNSVQVV